MLLKINPENPEGRKIKQAVETLENGGVIIYPTDTVYGLACDINNTQAIDRLCKLRGLDPTKANLTIICKDISETSEYTQQLDTPTFKFLKKNTPGPFTFILPANNQVPKMFRNRKRTIGVRIPDHSVPIALVEGLGRPIVTASLKSDDQILEYFTNPADIYEDYKKLVDLVIDSGVCGNTPSTVIDCTEENPAIIREGLSEPEA